MIQLNNIPALGEEVRDTGPIHLSANIALTYPAQQQKLPESGSHTFKPVGESKCVEDPRYSIYICRGLRDMKYWDKSNPGVPNIKGVGQ